MDGRFNLLEEPWIPVVDEGRASLRQIFTQPHYRSLGGNPIQKIALLKLLLAIAQAAITPKNENEWRALGAEGLSSRCLEYLNHWRDRFFLYGEHPFLQLPEIASAKVLDYGSVLPEVASGNTSVVSQIQVQRPLDDADKALLLVVLLGFALAGKKTDNSVVLSPGYEGKTNAKGNPSSSKPGPSVAHMGLLHNFILGDTLQQTLWLNLLSQDQIISKNRRFPEGLGRPPWEQMPTGENCPVAQVLRHSMIGRLTPLSRFCLLTDSGLHYSEGLAHPSYLEGVADPSAAINDTPKKPKALWADPDKRPWRELTALLSFISEQKGLGFQSWQLRCGLERARDVIGLFAVWSGGLRVSSNAGEQYISGSNDFVESVIWLHSDILGEEWFAQLHDEMNGMEKLAKRLYGCVLGFFKEQTVDGSKQAANATHLFWQLCEHNFQNLVNHCDQDPASADIRRGLHRRIASYTHQAFDQICPNDTARQLDAWAKFRPNNSDYLKQEN